MKKIVITGIILIFLLAMMGCGSGEQTSSSDNQAAGGNSENTSSESMEGTNSALNNGSDGSIAKKWPSNIGDIPEFTYGDIDQVQKTSEMYDGIEFLAYQIFYTNIKEGAGEKYSNELEKAGFKESQPPNESSMNGVTTIEYGHDKFTFETDDTIYNIQVDHWINDDNNGAVYIDIPINPGSNHNDKEDSEEINASDTGDNDNEGSQYNWNTLSDSNIPDDYPYNTVPLFGVDDADLLGADRQVMGGMGVSYIMVFGVNDEVEDVAAGIGEKLKKHAADKGGTFKTLTSQVFMGEIGDCEYTVSIGDGTADGYTTTVDYTVIQSSD